ncbi:ABC transporter substrate-binding protein [Curvivirga aplysinae]|uniref:ABC transporter substrate-binding protein n=1 Tax=Curvivirga aplysinae TaxID=2529852 RepID=UPI0012BCC660|nr:ABC transporter substrate-binding protein [Curvivirga aplysinae]MTI09494.1 ABC transporter ATP-binding protein [Curvivirga aplysinae]
MKLKLRAFLAASFAVFLSGSAIAADKVTVLLDWFVNPDHATLVIAKEAGFFKKYGLDVELIAPSDPSLPPKLVAAGQADLAVSYQPQLHVQVAEGLPLVRIGTLVATPLNSLVVLEDSPIKSIADLKGRKVGFSVGGFEDTMLSAMLGQHGLTLKDIELINVNFSLSPSLFAGQVDAVIGAFRNFELNQMDIEKRPGRAFYVEDEGVPAYDELILVAKSDRVGEEKLVRFMLALQDATNYMLNNNAKSLDMFIATDKALDNELNRRAWIDTMPRFALRPAALDHGRYTRFAEFMIENGMIKETPALETYAVDIFAEK